VAAYFAASSALENKHQWKEKERLAVWALDIEVITLYRNISIISVPGSASKNLAAQAAYLVSIDRMEKHVSLLILFQWNKSLQDCQIHIYLKYLSLS